jgi:pantoate--beta-alanine ligase
MKAPTSNLSPLVVADAVELRSLTERARSQGKSVGLVPTMGALHEGHLSLVDASKRTCDVSVVSIFVNPAQFAPGEDFHRYPRTLETDLQLLAGRGTEIVFTPSAETMYGAHHATFVEVAGPAMRLEGQFRPSHFRGVATIVLKLFNLVQPDRAFFGQKDYQQSVVVRRMVHDLDLPIQIDVCPTMREPDGLALSSRNIFLSSDERTRALAISASLRLARQLIEQGQTNSAIVRSRMRAVLEASDLKIDYVEVVDPETLESIETLDGPTAVLVAARVGATRLIDNALIG